MQERFGDGYASFVRSMTILYEALEDVVKQLGLASKSKVMHTRSDLKS